MSQTSKKSAPSAKLASESKAKAASISAIETTRSSAENVVKMGGKAVKDFVSSSAYDAQKAQEQMFAFTRDSSEQLVKSADAMTKAMYEMIGMSRDNIETLIECSNLTAALLKDMSAEVFEANNQAFSDSLELSKDFFSCRTYSDMFDLQNRLVKYAMDTFFNQSLKLSNMVFEYTNEALEPINERVVTTSEKMSKVLAA